MKFILSIIIILTFINVNAQEKYYIYFKDKGIQKGEVLSKISTEYHQAKEYLSERAIERRKKVMEENSIITYEDIPIKSEYVEVLKQKGVKIHNTLRWFNAVTAYLNEELIQEIVNLPFVNKIERVKLLKKSVRDINFEGLNKESNINQTEDFLYDYGNSFTQLAISDIPAVHTKGINGEGVIIGVLDTGYDWQTHESLLNANIIAEWDFIFQDSITADQEYDVKGQHNHGTLCFSVVGGFKDGSLIGASFNSAFLLAKTEDLRMESHLEEDNYAAALEWMETYGVDITTSSLGYSIFDDTTYSYSYSDMDGKTTIVTRAAELAFQRGVLTITSAGNEGNSSWYYITAPADGINTIAIGAVFPDNSIAGFSSRGPSFDGRIKPDVVAQGVGVLGATASTVSQYRYASGTSLSSPIAAGAAGLLLSAYPHLTNIQARRILVETADNAAQPNNERGYGLVSATRAIAFPNLEEINSEYKLYKTFFNSDGIKNETVKLHYSVSGSDFQQQLMNNYQNDFFEYLFPVLMQGELVEFYFTYENDNSIAVRDPLTPNKYYKLIYGSSDVVLNTSFTHVVTKYNLYQNYPNPFNPVTTIRYELPESSNVTLKVYDILGNEVAVLIDNEYQLPASYKIPFDAINLSSGVYFYRLNTGGFTMTKKMMLLR